MEVIILVQYLIQKVCVVVEHCLVWYKLPVVGHGIVCEYIVEEIRIAVILLWSIVEMELCKEAMERFVRLDKVVVMQVVSLIQILCVID